MISCNREQEKHREGVGGRNCSHFYYSSVRIISTPQANAPDICSVYMLYTNSILMCCEGWSHHGRCGPALKMLIDSRISLPDLTRGMPDRQPLCWGGPVGHVPRFLDLLRAICSSEVQGGRIGLAWKPA